MNPELNGEKGLIEELYISTLEKLKTETDPKVRQSLINEASSFNTFLNDSNERDVKLTSKLIDEKEREDQMISKLKDRRIKCIEIGVNVLTLVAKKAFDLVLLNRGFTWETTGSPTSWFFKDSWGHRDR